MYQAIVFLPLLGLPHRRRDRARRRARPPSRRAVRARGRGSAPTTMRPTPCARGAVGRMATSPRSMTRTTSRRARAGGGGLARRRDHHHALLFISMLLSWIAFVRVGFGHEEAREVAAAVHHLRRPQGRLGAAHRHADRRDAGRGHHRLGARPPLFDRLHGRGPVPAALLRLPVAVHLRDADAGDGRQPGPAVLRLGGRRASRAIC